MRIYTDTSVFGGYFDGEFAKWSKKLLAEFEDGLNTGVISDITLGEFLCKNSYVGQPWRSLVDNSICQAPYGMLDLQAG
jgi:hypothetical protein